jgi:hypothetical protein
LLDRTACDYSPSEDDHARIADPWTDSLTAEQHEVLTEIAAFIRPQHFDGSRRTAPEIEAFMALQKKAAIAFTQEDSQEAFTLQGKYLRQQ